MKKFESVRDFLNYVPRCLICNKNFTIYVNFKIRHDNDRSYEKDLVILMHVENNILCNYNKKYVIDLDSGITDESKINSTDQLIRWTRIEKKCHQCIFKIVADNNVIDVVINHNLVAKPGLFLAREEISYFIDNKTIYLDQIHPQISPIPIVFIYKVSSILTCNNIVIARDFCIDFQKINNFEQLNNKILTMITFQ